MRNVPAVVVWWMGVVAPLGVSAQEPSHPVVFMEPASGPVGRDSLETFTRVTDADRLHTYGSWLANLPARMAFALFDDARAVAVRRDPAAAERQPAAYYVALVPEGNHGDLGFRLRPAAGVEVHPRTAYIRLGPDEWRFGTTFLHETGHVVTHILSGGRRFDERPIASIPHSTAALTDRETAFREGYAIHLETFAARLDTSRASRNRYDHQQMPFGRIAEAPRVSEYYHALIDLLSFAQTVSRYRDVVENTFAFRSAWKDPDYLRVQLERSRDFAELRDANQLLQSEGFYASFFNALLFRGLAQPDAALLRERQRRLLEVLADVLAAPDAESGRPWLIDIVRAWSNRFPEESPEVVDVLLDLSHGVFVDSEARAVWRAAYLSAVRVDPASIGIEAIEARRQRWRDLVMDDPTVLESRLGPELRCRVRGREVQIVAFGAAERLSFDLNTVQVGILRMVPGLTDIERDRWQSERDRQPFSSFEDFERRVDPGLPARSVLSCDSLTAVR